MIRARWKGHLLELHNAARRWESVNKHAPAPTPGLPRGNAGNLELQNLSWGVEGRRSSAAQGPELTGAALGWLGPNRGSALRGYCMNPSALSTHRIRPWGVQIVSTPAAAARQCWGCPIKHKEPESLQNCSNPSTRAQHPQHPPGLGRSWEGISAGRLPLQHRLVSAFPNPKLIWTNNGSGYPNNLRPAGEIITASPEASVQRVIMSSTAG